MNRSVTWKGRLWTGLVFGAVAGMATVVLAQAPAGDGQMMKNMAAADQKLSELVARMNTATGDEKVTAIAAVVAELTAQRAQMQEHMRTHCAGKMASMHGNAGMMHKAPDAAPKAEPDHTAHHPDK